MNAPYGAPAPNFLLIGAAKCGTTSVANYLKQHPDVFVSTPKEPNFFAFEPNVVPTCKGPVDNETLYELLLKYSVTSTDAYQRLFERADGARAIGEASVRYLYAPDSARRIADSIPHVRLIAILRDPVDRMHSHYHMNVRKQIEPLAFADALDAEDERVANDWGWDWHYRRVGEYGGQLQRYFDAFDRDNMLVIFHSELVEEPYTTLRAIYQHLEVDPEFQPDLSRRALVGYTPRWVGLRKLIREENIFKATAKRCVPKWGRARIASWIEKKNRAEIPHLDHETRRALRARFADDSCRLESLLRRKVPW